MVATRLVDVCVVLMLVKTECLDTERTKRTRKKFLCFMCDEVENLKQIYVGCSEAAGLR
jgi:hypothetical protein